MSNDQTLTQRTAEREDSSAVRALKSLLLRTLSPAAVGRLEYFCRPSLRASWGGPMNGQAGRQRICRDIMKALQPAAIVETGTFRGTTTAFLAGFGAPVYTVELQPRNHAFASLSLRKFGDRVRLSLGDSRSFLRRLAQDPSVPKQSVFFYLDAHWNADLPLAEEITMIFATWSGAVIMIDDFAVPGDSYGYDDYGPGRALDQEYLNALGRTDITVFYPSLRADSETGAKRGCAVLCNDRRTRDRLEVLESLRLA